MSSTPVILCFSGADPTGGAGIQADIEAIASHGARAAPVITAVTVQNTNDVSEYSAIAADMVIQQARAVLEDMPVSCIKIGMVASLENVQAIHSVLRDYPDLPVIYDPVLSAGGGASLAPSNFHDAVKVLLLPLTHVLTPNTHEASALAPDADSPTAAAMSLLDTDCDYVLLTGTHADTKDITHSLYGNFRELHQYHYHRLPGHFHGSGCTLAASIAALLAHGQEPFSAIHQALDYTFKTLQHAQQLGMGQQHPNRFFWTEQEK